MKIDVAFSQLMPQLNLGGQAFQNNNQLLPRTQQNGYQVLANVSWQLYQGGAEYAAVRQARQQEQQARKLLDDARRLGMQQAIQAWETLGAARATAESTRAAIRANQIALEGVEREAIVGSRTTQDVLNQQQQLLNSQVTLVQNLCQPLTGPTRWQRQSGKSRRATSIFPFHSMTRPPTTRRYGTSGPERATTPPTSRDDDLGDSPFRKIDEPVDNLQSSDSFPLGKYSANTAGDFVVRTRELNRA